jgi:hypothetical protein
MEVAVGNKNLVAGAVVALDAAGREHLVVVTKATWRIPLPRQRPGPLPPEALQQTDLYVAEPGMSAMLYGSDFARFKPHCDVLFNASAHSPDGEPVTQLAVGWRVGPLSKRLNVVGPRTWSRAFGSTALSAPAPFTRLPLHYGLAFGGKRIRLEGKGDARQFVEETLPSNPSGVGYAATVGSDIIDGVAVPSLEAINEPFARPADMHAPVAFSAIGRHWLPRKDHSGTCDDAWRRDVFPLLPADFDEQFHQCAPQDQQMDYPRGGEEVILLNMMAGRPDVRFHLPMLGSVPVRVLRKDYSVETCEAVVDTLYFEPDQERFSVVWRTSLPVRRRAQEFEAIAVGPVDPTWWAARSMGLDGSECAGCGPEESEALMLGGRHGTWER